MIGNKVFHSILYVLYLNYKSVVNKGSNCTHAKYLLFLRNYPLQIRCQKHGQTGIQLSDCVENIVGKGEIARYEQFLRFPQCFQKLSVVDASKRVSME